MTFQPPVSASSPRDSLRARIEAAERRNAERTLADNARQAAKAAADYTRAHPMMVIGGALAVGLAIGLLTQPGRRVAGRVAGRVASSAGGAVSGAAAGASSGVKSLAARGGTRLGAMLGQAAVGYVMTMIDDVLETARSGQERAGELTDSAGTTARSIAHRGRSAAGRVVADVKRKTKG